MASTATPPPSSPKSPSIEVNPKPKELTNENSPKIYGPLALSRYSPETRSFTIKSGEWNDQVEVFLKKHSLRSPKRYFAISYAWKETAGYPDAPMETILVNGHNFKISSNLAAGLRAFRSSYPDQTFWADAICHNQDDDAEMNIQLGHMRDVYQRCAELHIWLGKEGPLYHPDSSPPTDNGRLTKWTSTYRKIPASFDCAGGAQREKYETSAEDDMRVKQFNEDFWHHTDLPHAFRGFSKQDFREGALVLLHVLARGDHLSMNPERHLSDNPDLQFIQELRYRDGVFEALKDIIDRCWWSRQWVIQETVLPHTAFVHYGGFTIPWSMLSAAQATVQTHSIQECCTKAYAKLRDSDSEVLTKFTHIVHEVERWRTIWQDASSAKSIKIIQLLWVFCYRDAGRAADKLYALLPLARDWEEEKAVEVHYDWDDYHIFAALPGLLFDVHDSLLPLMGTTLKSEHTALKREGTELEPGEVIAFLPSWARDWSVHPPADELARLERTLLYHASGLEKDEKGRILRSSDNSERLKFRTRHQVTLIEEHISHNVSCLRYIELRGLIHSKIATIGSIMPNDTTFAANAAFLQWFELALMDEGAYIGAENYASGQGTRVEAYCRTLCMDTEYVDENSDDENLPLDRKDYQRATFKHIAPLIDMVQRLQNAQPEHRRLDRAEGIRHIQGVTTWRPAQGSDPDSDGPSPMKRRKVSTEPITYEQDKLKKINTAIRTATSDRVFFITENGYMGLGPAFLREGDEVAVLAGGHTPFVLRPTEQRLIEGFGQQLCRELIGDCFVHGLMDGEAVENINAREELEQLFLE